MIRDLKSLAYYMEIRDFSEESLTECLSRKVPDAWLKASSQERVHTKDKTVLAEARGNVVADGIIWSNIKIEGMLQKVVPQEIVDCLEAELMPDGSLHSKPTFMPLMMKFLHAPTDRIKVRLAPEGYKIQFKVKLPVYAIPRLTLSLGKEDCTESLSITFPFTEEDWDKTVKELRFL